MINEKILDISWGTILKISLAAFAVYTLYNIRDILVWFVFALILSILFNPLIDFLQSKRIPRALATVIVFLGIFGLLGSIVYLTIPAFVSEIKQFSEFLPQYFEKIAPPLKGLGIQAFENINSFTSALEKALDKMGSSIFGAVFAFFGGIFSAFFVISIAIFLSLDERAVEKSLILLFPKRYESFVLSVWEKCQKKVSGWFLTRILGSLFVGFFSYIAFLVFSVQYPFALGLIAGALNFIPMLGGIVGGGIILLLVSMDSLTRALFVLVAFTLIQQIEGNVFTPILTRKFIGLPPVLVLLALVIGGKLWGIMGAILVLPLAGILFEFIKDFLEKRREERPVVS